MQTPSRTGAWKTDRNLGSQSDGKISCTDLRVSNVGWQLKMVEAGPFGEWLTAMRAVLRGERDAEVPCGDCVGCCISAYPIPLRPNDHVALDKVPARHLHLPSESGGLARMGYGEDGNCPMLCAGRCSIYSDRPQTCRDYDCRIYAAAGLLPDGDRPVIRQRVQKWQFAFDSADDRDAAEAVQRAALFIRSHAQQFPASMRAGSATAAAVLALKCYELFLDATYQPGSDDDASRWIQRITAVVRRFNSSQHKQ
jgi:uncharacterized protein